MNKIINFFFVFFMFFSMTLFCKRFVRHNLSETFKPWFKIVQLEEILKKNSNISYKNCFGPVNFELRPFSLSPLFPYRGYFKDCFILEIPHGRVQGQEGIVFINNEMIREMVWADQLNRLKDIPKIDPEKIIKVSGRVAVISQECHDNYCHFFNEILARLAMLEMHGVIYDWLYIACDKQFVKDGLKLWGIDEAKIISPTGKNFAIQADKLILPSLVLNTNNGFKHTGVNAHPYTLKYVREKLLHRIENKIDMSQFCKRIFISRRDAPSRKILNENEIFELFKAKGFERYDTGKMLVAEQIALFAQAEMVVGEHGAGLTGVLFCQEKTKFIEFFQILIDSSFWFPAQIFNLEYVPVNLLDINADIFFDWQNTNHNIYFKAIGSKVVVPLEKIKKIVEAL